MPPTGERDLVVFIAPWKPELYRLVGQQPTPYGTARFYNPKAIVADGKQNCLYVLDEPREAAEKVKLWRIAGDGSARVILQTETARAGGPFGLRVGLGLDNLGRPLIADADSGLWRVNPDGRLQQLLEGKDKPLFRMTAVTGSLRGLLIATSYLYDIRETASGLPEVARNQGGLYRVDLATNPAGVHCLQENRRPGEAEYGTHWRTGSQVFVDAAGRTVLVDSGSTWTRTEDVYTGTGAQTTYPQQRVTKSVVNGGVFVLHPDGRFEDLTFKTPQSNSGPLRRPAGAAQWSEDTYIVADPEMYVEGINGAGGLLLLKLDGSREARWPFGYRLKPAGVAILRGAGTPAKVGPALPMRIADLAGVTTAGPITRIESVSLERKPEGGGGLLGSVVTQWDPQPAEQAEQVLRSFFEGARWTVAEDGALQFVARGVTPQQEGTPWVMQGKATVHDQMANISASYPRKNLYDAQIGSIDARLNRPASDHIRMNVTINVFTSTERLKATFEQTMPWKQKN